MNYNVETVEEYLEVVPHERKEMLLRIFMILKEYFPEIDGNMKYNMPTFEPVCAVASQKNYVSVYIHHFDLVEKYRIELGKLKVGKSCIRFKSMEQVPENILRKIFSEIKSKE